MKKKIFTLCILLCQYQLLKCQVVTIRNAQINTLNIKILPIKNKNSHGILPKHNITDTGKKNSTSSLKSKAQVLQIQKKCKKIKKETLNRKINTERDGFKLNNKNKQTSIEEKYEQPIEEDAIDVERRIFYTFENIPLQKNNMMYDLTIHYKDNSDLVCQSADYHFETNEESLPYVTEDKLFKIKSQKN